MQEACNHRHFNHFVEWLDQEFLKKCEALTASTATNPTWDSGYARAIRDLAHAFRKTKG